jgi:hypothetical protein
MTFYSYGGLKNKRYEFGMLILNLRRFPSINDRK